MIKDRNDQYHRKVTTIVDAVVIDAPRWFLSELSDWPNWVQDAIENGDIECDRDSRGILVRCCDGEPGDEPYFVPATNGEWLVRWPNQRLIVYTPELFENSFTPATKE